MLDRLLFEKRATVLAVKRRHFTKRAVKTVISIYGTESVPLVSLFSCWENVLLPWY